MDENPNSDICLSESYRALNVIICSGRSKEFLGRSLTTTDLDAMSSAQMNAYYKMY